MCTFVHCKVLHKKTFQCLIALFGVKKFKFLHRYVDINLSADRYRIAYGVAANKELQLN